MHLLSLVERHLKRSATPPTRFGREAVGDPNFVRELRRGREVGEAIAVRVFAFIERAEAQAQAQAGAASCRR